MNEEQWLWYSNRSVSSLNNKKKDYCLKQQPGPSLLLSNVQISSAVHWLFILCVFGCICKPLCRLCVGVFRCRWLPVKVRRSTWQCRLKEKGRRGVPLVLFPQRRFFCSSLGTACEPKLLCTSGKNKKNNFSKRSALPRAQQTKPKYLCLRKSCFRGDDSLSRAH